MKGAALRALSAELDRAAKAGRSEIRFTVAQGVDLPPRTALTGGAVDELFRACRDARGKSFLGVRSGALHPDSGALPEGVTLAQQSR